MGWSPNASSTADNKAVPFNLCAASFELKLSLSCMQRKGSREIEEAIIKKACVRKDIKMSSM
jgi:hypothetical protein